MRKLLLKVIALIVPICVYSQTYVKVRAKHESWPLTNNATWVDSNLVESGNGFGGQFKFTLVLFDEFCELQDTLELGQYAPYGSTYQVYHYRFNETNDMIQLDSTMRYRIPDGKHDFLYTPFQYRADFVQAAHPPTFQLLDSLWGNEAANASTVIILYGIAGDTASHEAIIANYQETIIMEKIICHDLAINENDKFSSNYTIYPIPAFDQLVVDFQSKGTRTIEILNSVGEIIYSTEIHNSVAEIDVSNYAKGHFLLRVKDETRVRTHNLILR